MVAMQCGGNRRAWKLRQTERPRLPSALSQCFAKAAHLIITYHLFGCGVQPEHRKLDTTQ